MYWFKYAGFCQLEFNMYLGGDMLIITWKLNGRCAIIVRADHLQSM